MHNEDTEDLARNRQVARRMAQTAACAGDPICGALFSLESIARDMGLEFVAGIEQDYDPNEEDLAVWP